MTETKRDVFDEVRRVALQDETLLRTANIHVLLKQDEEWHSRYDAALPDDLPVIPELIGKYLKMWKHDHGDLFQVFDEGTSASLDGTKWESVQDWFSDAKDSFDTFARAWVLGVWRVEETGEIVKLEEEK
ncbi:hypothetical protein LacP0625_10135 [Lacticaseibacillus paracasei subsp. tolerans]|uniref:hypothetical protein n=1 Tax=Lacticaseibacillus paracasei TaxID=1597 RepID=UPI001892A0DF|nr:hypothetical protein [Lacticaseibacillus paracasei]QPC20998.1 hypothetical protein LacP0625_10135 [Lacticaseibacillus paracasei subsp. tolerans]